MKNQITTNKVKSVSELTKIVKSLKAKNKKIVFTNGCFDIFHVGHIDYLEKSKSLGDVLVVGLNSDASVKRIKGDKRPIVSQKNRARVLSNLAVVDFIVVFNDFTPIKLIKAIKPDVLVKGGDWNIKDIVGAEFVQFYGGKVKNLPYIKGFSTSQLIDKIKSL